MYHVLQAISFGIVRGDCQHKYVMPFPIAVLWLVSREVNGVKASPKGCMQRGVGRGL